MGHRKGDQQQPDGKHQPRLVGIPERPDGGDHAVAVGIAGPREQDADTQVVAVENDIDQDRQAHEDGEDHRQPVGREERLHSGHSPAWP